MGCIGNRINNGEELNIGNFALLKQSQLAEGAYGEVWKCKGIASDSLFALK